ncbi:MAG TPA: phage tail tape measure protein, partial [Spirochaetia bacterium]|nr:phage tail tape measure protein [Spirochaetia bacterium]
KKASEEWSLSHKQTAKEFLQASYMMSSAGLNSIEAIEGTKTALALATATMGNGVDAANLVAKMYNNFGDRTANVNTEMVRLGDTLAKTQQLFQIANLQQLDEGLKYASSTALSAKISFEQMNTVIGMLNTVGLQGSLAGSAFQQSLANITKASKTLGFSISRNVDGSMDFIETLENIKNTGKTSMDDLNRAFGIEGARGISLLINKVDELKKAYGTIQTAGGTLSDSVRKMENSYNSIVQKMKNSFFNFAVTLGNALLPVMTQIADKISAVVNIFSRFAQENPRLSATLIQVFTAVSGVLAVFGSLGYVVGKLSEPVMKGISLMKKFGLGIAGAGMKLIKFIGITEALAKTKAMSEFMQNNASMLGKFDGSVMSSMQKLKFFGKEFFNLSNIMKFSFIGIIVLLIVKWDEWSDATKGVVVGLGILIGVVWALNGALYANPLVWIVGIIGLVIAGIYLLIKNIDSVIQWFRKLYDESPMLQAMLLPIQLLVEGFSWLIDKISEFLDWFDKIGGFKGLDTMLKAKFFTMFYNAIQKIKSLFSSIGKFFVDLWNSAIDKVKGFFTDLWESVKKMFSGIGEEIAGVLWGGAVGKVDKAGQTKKRVETYNSISKVYSTITGVKIPEIEGYAKGTDFFSGGVALVGEHGPEIMTMPRGTSIRSNPETNRLLKNVQNNSNQVSKVSETKNYSIKIENLSVNADDIESISGFFKMLQTAAGVS